MNISLHWQVARSGLAGRNEGIRSSTVHGTSFKNVLGCQPHSLQQSVHIQGFSSTINKAWKERFRQTINKQFRKDKKAVIFVDNIRFEHSARTPEKFANDLANLILRHRAHQNGRDHIDNQSKVAILADYKNMGS